MSALKDQLPADPRILIVVLRRIGDVLLTTPLIRSLRRGCPQATIDVLVFDGTAGIIEGNPDVNNVIAIPERPAAFAALALISRLWRRYDLAVATQSGDRPHFLAFAAGKKRVGLVPADSGPGAKIKRFSLTGSVVADEKIHRVELMLRLAEALGILRVPETVAPRGRETAELESTGRYAVIHATPMFRYKQWTRQGWRALGEGLKQRNLPIIAVGGPGEAERHYLEELWEGLATIRQLPWPQTAALIAQAQVYVGADTAATHLAAATGCRTVAIYGPTDPRLWGPWPAGGLRSMWDASRTIQNRGNVWLVQNPLPCMPCQLEGCERHIDSRSACLDELRPEQVLAAVDQALA
jgi:heptosyltransferase-3